jgi:hypothetical protein
MISQSGCAIQIPFMWCQNPTVQERMRTNVRANIDIIQAVAAYWKFAALLVRLSLLEYLSRSFC